MQLSIDNDEVKYLGVIVDKQLRCRSHIEKVRMKCLSLPQFQQYLPKKPTKWGFKY